MAGTAPFQLLLDCPAVSSIVTSGTVTTVNLASSHFIPVGGYVQIQGVGTAAPGTALNTVWQVATVPNGTAFTVNSGAISAGTASVGSAVVALDLLQPLGNYSTAARVALAYADPGSLTMSASGDGQPGQMGFVVYQDDTPTAGPWFTLVSDQPRVRLFKKETGSAPSASDLYFIGIVTGIDAEMNEAGQGTRASVSCADANIILDKVIIYGAMPKL